MNEIKQLNAVGRVVCLCAVACFSAAVLASTAVNLYPVDNAAVVSDAASQSNPEMRGYSLVMTNGYGDVYRMNMLRDRANYQAYRGICSYRGFSLSGCATTGEVVMLRIKATPTMPEHFSILSTSLRWGTTMYVLNDVFRPLNDRVMAGYENWYPFDMSCSVAMYVHQGGFGNQLNTADYRMDMPVNSDFDVMSTEDRGAMFEGLGTFSTPAPRSYSLVMTNGYGDVYRMNMLRDRANYQAYRGICSYRGFSLSGCATTGEVVMLRIKATPTMPEHFSLVSTSLRWGTTMYFLNDVFRPLNDWVMTGYENWYPFDMSCSVAMYVQSGGFGARTFRPEPLTATARDQPLVFNDAGGTNLIGVLLPLTGDLADMGASYQSALMQAMHVVTNTPGMPPIRLVTADTRTDAAVAYEQLRALHSNGCHIVLGPQTSEECRILKSYANENNLLLISSSSTAVPLALPEDNLMRLVMDDSNQARVLAELLEDDGITELAILSRTDIYGDGFVEALVSEHNARGGVVFATNYCPRVYEFIPEIVSNIADQIAVRSAARGAHRVGIVTILFDEGVDVLRAAAAYPALGDVRWYGCDGMALNNALPADDTAAAFAVRTQYACSIAGGFTNPLYDVVAGNVSADTGNVTVRPYPMILYDGLSVVAEVISQYGSTQTMAELTANIKAVAGVYSGCTGPIYFNQADDRADGDYEFHVLDMDGGAYAWMDLAGKMPGVPGNLTASQGAYADGIKVAWNSVSGAGGYELWGALAGDTATAIKLTETADTEYWVMGAPADTVCHFQVKAINANGAGELTSPAAGWRQSVVGPCVRVNGSRLPLAVMAGDMVSVTTEMQPGVYAGVDADWWLAVQTPSGWYYRDMTGSWRAGDGAEFTPAWQGILTDISAREVLNIPAMEQGVYTFHFGVDARDGVLDPANLWLSSVQLTVY